MRDVESTMKAIEDMKSSGWTGFPIGDSDDFAQEVQATGENQALLSFLAERRSNGKRIPLADVKQRLGLN